MQPITVCERIAAAQHGVIARAQARDAGLSESAIDRRVADRRWTPMHPGVYAVWIPTHPRERWRQGLMGGVLWLGPGSAASHRAAALERGFEGIASAPFEFTTSSWRRSDRADMVVHRTTTPLEVVTVGVIPVTSVERTLLDLSAVVAPRALELAVEHALRRGLTTRSQLLAALEHSQVTRSGRRAMRELLARYSRASGSSLEVLVWRLLIEDGQPLPVRQYQVWDRGRIVAVIDLAYPDAMLAIEPDGFASHSGVREFQRDRERQNDLVRLGWTVYRVTWEMANERKHQVAREIGELRVRGLREARPHQIGELRARAIRQQATRGLRSTPASARASI